MILQKAPNNITLIFDRMIKNKYIHFNMNFDDYRGKDYTTFLSIFNLRTNHLKDKNATYIKFINNIKGTLPILVI